MSEETFKNYVLKGLAKHWDGAVKHADGYTAGIADLSGYIEPAGNVFIELKAAHKWPARATTPVKFDLDDLQREFILDRKGWVMARVNRDYMIWNYGDAYFIIDTKQATKERLLKCAAMHWKNAIDFSQLANIIRRRYKPSSGAILIHKGNYECVE